MIRKISKTNPALQVDLFGCEEYEPLRAVLIREDEQSPFMATLKGTRELTAVELRKIADHLDIVNGMTE
jgi:hypothetical protein